jgi:phytoene dehydrogenase-like protein
VRSFSTRDAERLPAYFKMLDSSVALLRRQLLETPPTDPHRIRDMWSTFKLGRHFLKLDAEVQRDIHELFTRSAGDLLDHWFETDVALPELPKFSAAPRNDNGAHLGSGIILAPSLEYMDHAYAQARLNGMSDAPIVEMLIPSTLDRTLAPKGAHVASLFCQHFSYKLPGGRDWRQERQRAVDLIFATVDSYAPNFRASVVGHSALSPLTWRRSSPSPAAIFSAARWDSISCGRRGRC